MYPPPVVTQEDDNSDDALNFADPEDVSAAADVINNTFCHLRDADGAPCDFVDILSHCGTSVSNLELELLWSNGMVTWAPLANVQSDQPSLVAKYVLANTIEGDKGGSLARWARVALRTLKRSIRRIRRAYRMTTLPDHSMSVDEWSSLPTQPRIRRSTNAPARRPSSSGHTDRSNHKPTKKKKAGRNNRHLGEVKYGVRIPRNVREALIFDEENGDTQWTDAMSKEIAALQHLNCFRVQERQNWNPRDEGYQYAPLRLIFDVKSDGRRKARLVVGGHVVRCDLNTYASTVKTLSVRLLHVIAEANGLTPLCGDVGNAFVNSFTNEKVYCRAGPEFGPLEGKTLIVVKSLYGLKSSAERWRAHFADTLRSMGFVSSRADSDVWLRCREDETGYDYICTHVDDFTIFAKEPWPYMRKLQSLYVIRDVVPPHYYLGNDFFRDADGGKYIGSSTYVSEAINKLEATIGVLSKERSPCLPGDHPELDTSALLDPDSHRFFQMLIGMGVWIVQLGRFDIAFAVTNLSRFTAAPRQGHLDRAIRIFGYLKRHVQLQRRSYHYDIFYGPSG